ncbi:MAG: hypothetical protein KKH72_10005 [Alphaproteobacteria bacterium]|nr:hypothetical protein [Alphaproteobacteria bacterium]
MKTLKWIARTVRTTLFLGVLCVSLAVSTASLGLWAVSLTTQVTALTVGAATAALAESKAVAKAVAKAKAREKAKARLKRVLVALPLVGIAAAAAFEYGDYREWQEENPEGDFGDYGCEVAALSAEVVNEVLQDLPEATRPPRDAILSRLPACDAPIVSPVPGG